MTENTRNYRICTDPQTRRLVIQTAGTWAEVDSIQFPDEPGLIAAVIRGIKEFEGTPETAAAPKKPAAGTGKKNK